MKCDKEKICCVKFYQIRVRLTNGIGHWGLSIVGPTMDDMYKYTKWKICVQYHFLFYFRRRQCRRLFFILLFSRYHRQENSNECFRAWAANWKASDPILYMNVWTSSTVKRMRQNVERYERARKSQQKKWERDRMKWNFCPGNTCSFNLFT